MVRSNKSCFVIKKNMIGVSVGAFLVAVSLIGGLFLVHNTVSLFVQTSVSIMIDLVIITLEIITIMIAFCIAIYTMFILFFVNVQIWSSIVGML